MPLYDYRCTCGWFGELALPIDQRDQAICPECMRCPERQLAAPLGRMRGQNKLAADHFTADMLGVPLKDLPDSLRTGPQST
jgi:putative FmdB family regulatory protein